MTIWLVFANPVTYFVVQAAAKVTHLWSKEVRLQNPKTMELIYNPKALSSSLNLLGRHSPGRSGYINSVDPCVLKSSYYIVITTIVTCKFK